MKKSFEALQVAFKDKIKPNEHSHLLSDRMQAYAGGYIARIEESLAEVYVSIKSLLGEEAFHAVAYAYASEVPSYDYNLSFKGRELPDFLSRSVVTLKKPYLVDLANFEWLIWESFHAFDAASMTRGDLAHISPEEWENALFHFQNTVKIFKSNWTVFDLWLNRKNADYKLPAESALKKEQFILIYRQETQVMCQPMDALQFQVLSGLMDHKTLGTVCEKLESQLSDPSLLSGWFSFWIQNGLIRNVHLAS